MRGLELLRRADVVVFDALANPLLLRETRPDTECIPVRPRDMAEKMSQQQINELLVRKALDGKFVVRLKGGDPYLFGRGAEEAAYIGSRGIACEVVPGVTAGIAVPMAAGIPMTRRDVASTVTFVTGHEDPSKEQPGVDYRAVADLIRCGGSACFYMAAERTGAIAERLQCHGLNPDTPVAAVQWGFTPRQLSIRTTLGAVTGDFERAGLGPPMIMVIGPVAAVEEPGLDFYTNRPLFGRRIIITRTRHQASDLRRLLSEFGAEVLEAPTIELVEPADMGPVDKAIRELDRFDWLVLTSVNGVEALADRMDGLGLDGRHLSGVLVAAIGDATEAALKERLALRADLVPPDYVSESLAEQLIRRGVSGKSILMCRADIARPQLRVMLGQAGAAVTDLAIYESRLTESLDEEVLAALRDADVDWITFTSSSTVKNMVELLGPERELLRGVRIASIGPITSDTVRELGFKVAAEARPSNLQGLVEAIVAAS